MVCIFLFARMLLCVLQVAWCIGTCAKMFPFEVQFGHAGALANSELQTADAKNEALKAAGAIVPDNFNDFVARIAATFSALVAAGGIGDVRECEQSRCAGVCVFAQGVGALVHAL